MTSSPLLDTEKERQLPSIRILLVDDFKDWRNQVRLLLQERPGWQVIGEVSDGSEAVQKAEELKPDLILLDNGLPNLNGIEAARQIRQVSPNSKIIFLSMDNSLNVVQVALSTGAQGYVYKSRAKNDLLSAIDAVLRDEQFVSSMVKGYKFTDTSGPRARPNHEVLFYSDDAVFLDSLARFVAGALEAGDAAIVIATESHRENLVQRLKAQGLNVDAAVRQGTFIPLDGAKTLSSFMVNGMPDSTRLFEGAGNFITAAAKASKKDHPRIAVCGECGFLLWAEGKGDAAICLEQLWEQLAATYEVYSLCGYALSSFHREGGQHVFQNICAEHSSVYSQ
jgi:DNA-binding NarL/FixJ family response regulator